MNKRDELKAMLVAVDCLAAEMKKKLRAKARDGYSGGLDRSSWYTVSKMLHDNADRLTGLCPHCHSHDGEHDREDGARQAVDVCNLAMMLWVIGSPEVTERTKGGTNDA